MLAGLALARVRSLEPDVDLATWSQATWLVGNGHGTRLTIPVPAEHMADLHGALVMYPVAWVTRFLPIREALVVVQAAALSFTVLPLWRLARRVVNLRVGAAAALVLAYCAYPPLHQLNLAGFHPEALAVPALVAMCYRGLSGSIVRFSTAALVATACRADFAILVASFGALLVLGGRRRAGAAALVGGLGWTVAAIFVPWLGAGDEWLAEPGAFDRYGDSVAGVIGWFITHPFDTIAATFGRPDVTVLAALFLPLALLPFLSFRHLAPLVPLQLLYLVGELSTDALLAELAVPAIAFGLVATAFGLGRSGRVTSGRVSVHPRVSAALLATSVVFFLLDSPASPYEHPWSWGSRDELDVARLRLVDLVEDEEVVAATADFLPLVAARRSVCVMPRAEPCPDAPQVYLLDT
ncbi:MAG TPA: DUF2079 domain-containing protein, partial [Acidimicrobiales bacterium]|nr:DUF2079 domain-containing protein [Acidimicrobiales bacterium]